MQHSNGLVHPMLPRQLMALKSHLHISRRHQTDPSLSPDAVGCKSDTLPNTAGGEETIGWHWQQLCSRPSCAVAGVRGGRREAGRVPWGVVGVSTSICVPPPPPDGKMGRNAPEAPAIHKAQRPVGNSNCREKDMKNGDRTWKSWGSAERAVR